MAVKRVNNGQGVSLVRKGLGLSDQTLRNWIKAAAFEYIEVFYNRKRQHSTLGYTSPAQFLENWIKQQNQKKLVV